jgi:alpha-tubulin suppressor-like RCC1 family protein
MREIFSVWGGNASGQLRAGDTINQSVPIPVKSFEGVRKPEVGSGHVVALVEDGRESPDRGFSLTIHAGTEKP